MKFGDRLKNMRIQSRLSLREAAHLIGVPESTYREWEYGRQIRGHTPYLKITKAFKISLDYLFGVSSEAKSLGEEFVEVELLLSSIKKKVLKSQK